MEFLKKVFGDKALTYEELKAALEQDKEIKLANLASGQYVDKEKFDRAEAKATGLQAQLDEAGKTIKGLKELDADGLKKSVKDWEDKYKADTKALEEKLARQAIDSKIDLALTGAKARNLTAARAVLNEMGALDGVKLDGDQLMGLKEPLEKAMKEHGYLFGEGKAQNPPPPVPGGTPAPADEMAKWREMAGLPPAPAKME